MKERTMPKPILVGYDPRSADRAPIRFGVAAARFIGAPLVVGSVVADSGGGRMGHGEMEDEVPGDAASSPEDVRRELAAEGVRAECRAIEGASAPAGLHNAAEQLDAGLLVVGSSARGQRSRLVRGSTAERLLHGAPCPVAVVPRDWEEGGGLSAVGVAFADSPEGREALDSGLALARSAGATVRVLVAIKAKEFGRSAAGRPGGEATSYDAAGAEIDAFRDGLLAEASRIEPGLAVEVDVSAQDAAEFLVAASEHLDLLVCGSRGYGPKRAVLLGGVSGKVTAAAHCPVIVLARGVDEGMRALLGDRAGAVA
jgi:nucleotide-binding universal stress UspA family protein